MNPFKTDMHNHSVRSRCARPEMTIEAMAIALIPDEAFVRIARDMARNRITIEFNGVLEEADYAQEMIRFYRVCKAEGVKFSLGSDAHWLDGMGSIARQSAYIDALGVTEKDIWVPEV